MEYKQPMIAPIKAGQEVGVVKFIFDGKQIAKYPLVSLESIDNSNIFSRTWDEILLVFN
jgi:D-alanyl-D-alanine carboxypeptidase (penicillin-binding protein 5/6)